MKMKKYSAVTMTEAMSKVRADLGDDAVILNSKVVYTKGFLGLFKKKTIEVVAGMDKYETPLQPVQSLQKEMISSIKKEEVVSSELKKELSDIKMLVQSMQRPVETKKYTEEIESFLQYLRNHEINEELITRIGDELFEHAKESDSNNQSLSFRQIATQVLKEALKDVPFGGLSYQKKYINVLGPTGVEKRQRLPRWLLTLFYKRKRKLVLLQQIHIELLRSSN